MAFIIECMGGVPILVSSELVKYRHPNTPDAFDDRVPELEVCVKGFCKSQCVIDDDDGFRVFCQAINPNIGVEGVKTAVALALAAVVYKIGPSPTDTPQ